MNKKSSEQLLSILSTLRQRIELEDEDFHYDAVLEARDKILAITDIQIGLEMLSARRMEMLSDPGPWGR